MKLILQTCHLCCDKADIVQVFIGMQNSYETTINYKLKQHWTEQCSKGKRVL